MQMLERFVAAKVTAATPAAARAATAGYECAGGASRRARMWLPASRVMLTETVLFRVTALAPESSTNDRLAKRWNGDMAAPPAQSAQRSTSATFIVGAIHSVRSALNYSQHTCRYMWSWRGTTRAPKPPTRRRLAGGEASGTAEPRGAADQGEDQNVGHGQPQSP